MFKINNINFFKELESTNDYLINNYTKYDNLSLVVAETQSKGRGRKNNIWNSTYKDNLYFSVLLKDLTFFKKLTHIPILSSLCVFRTINSYKIKVKIKWPNDIVYAKDNIYYKISGILIDSFKDYMVLGFGINLNIAPIIIDQKTECLKNLLNMDIDKNEFLNKFILNFEIIFDTYHKHGFSKFIKEYNQNVYKINEYLKIVDDLNLHEGIFKGIDNNGFAILSNNNKLTTILNGEVKNNL